MVKSSTESGFFKSKNFTFRKKNKYIATQQTPEEYFKQKFIEGLMDFKDDAQALSRGYVALSDGWKDISGYVGVTSLFTTGSAVIGGLAIAGVITGVASLGIGFAVALVGIGAEVGYVVYRSKKKDKEFKRASDFFNGTEIDTDSKRVAGHLAGLYQNQLERCSLKYAERLAKSMVASLKYQILKNKDFEYGDLLDRAALQAVLLKSNKHMKKSKLKLTSDQSVKHNTRSLISRPALYCAENDKLYTCQKSRPEKYGIIYFKTKQGLEDYQSWVKRLKKNKDKWDYAPMISTEERKLRERLSFFSQQHVSFKEQSHSSEYSESKERVPGAGLRHASSI